MKISGELQKIRLIPAVCGEQKLESFHAPSSCSVFRCTPFAISLLWELRFVQGYAELRIGPGPLRGKVSTMLYDDAQTETFPINPQLFKSGIPISRAF